MSVVSHEQIEELVKKSHKALSKSKFFDAERLANEALYAARDQDDFARMAEILPPLAEARGKRLDQALEATTITILDEPLAAEPSINPGCFLVRPPLVGADARRYRLAALERKIPVAVICREPTTKNGMIPIVAISSGATIRLHIEAPEDEDSPDLDWFLDCLDALGDWSIEMLDPQEDVERRIDKLLAFGPGSADFAVNPGIADVI